MGSPYSRLGVGIAINGIAALFLGYTLISDGGDFYLNLNRTYLALTIVAPMLVALLLVMLAIQPEPAIGYILAGACAGLLLAGLVLPPAPGVFAGDEILARQGQAAPAQATPAEGMLARY